MSPTKQNERHIKVGPKQREILLLSYTQCFKQALAVGLIQFGQKGLEIIRSAHG